MNAVVLISYVIAVVVPLFALYLIWALDLFSTGGGKIIGICFAWGAVGAFIPAYIVNTALIKEIGASNLTRFGAPIAEEVLKAAVLIFFIYRPSFRYSVDGATYGFAAGIGFAMSENLFIYLDGAGDAALAGAIGRVLSATLMHAAASAIVGISLGRLRRAKTRRYGPPVAGIALSIALHVGYNNVVRELSGTVLLLAAIGIGIGGGVVIAVLINQALSEEKRSFGTVLNIDTGVSTGERKAIQRVGAAEMEQVFGDLRERFGDETTSLIRRLFATQANIGILQNNLSVPASDRLRAAWKREIAGLEVQMRDIRQQLSGYINTYLEEMFPPGDAGLWDSINTALGESDPTLVHTFDTFMRMSELAQSFDPEQLVAMAESLHQAEIFHNVPLYHLENLSRALTVMNLAEGQMLFEKGDAGDAMYLVRVDEDVQHTPDLMLGIEIFVNEDEVFRTFGDGGVVGEFALLDGRPRSASARANCNLTVLALKQQVFRRFISSRPAVIHAMLQYLAEKLRYTTDAVETARDRASKIARGEYDTVKAMTGVSTQILKQETGPDAASLGPEELSPDTEQSVGRLFGLLAHTLARRERQAPKQPPHTGRLDAVE
jgi:RsiW-degrading membrane proteinase PrsW (M82 family)/CRP-like cAMP-binding protein